MAVFEDPYEYLNGPAMRLQEVYPACREYISRLLGDYKTRLSANVEHMGGTYDEVIDKFQDEVILHCHRRKPPRRKAAGKRSHK